MTKRTYQPKIRRRMRVHGFRARMATKDGRDVLKRRRAPRSPRADRVDEQPLQAGQLERLVGHGLPFREAPRRRLRRLDYPAVIAIYDMLPLPFACATRTRSVASGKGGGAGSIRCLYLYVIAQPQESLSVSRFAFAVGRHIGRATVRNRAKPQVARNRAPSSGHNRTGLRLSVCGPPGTGRRRSARNWSGRAVIVDARRVAARRRSRAIATGVARL